MMLTQTLLNLALYHKILCFSCEVFKKTLKLRKMSKHWSLKETRASYKLVFDYKNNPKQNTLEKIKKSTKVTGNQKTLSVLAYLLNASTNILFWEGRLETVWLCGDCVPVQFWDFPNISWFPKILSLRLLGNLWSNSIR